MSVFAARTGKAELLKVAEYIQDIEVTDHIDAAIGTLALTVIAMIRTSPQDEAYRLHLLSTVMAGER